MNNKEEVTYPLKINKLIWKRFKDKIPRTENLNDYLVRLIEKEAEKK